MPQGRRFSSTLSHKLYLLLWVLLFSPLFSTAATVTLPAEDGDGTFELSVSGTHPAIIVKEKIGASGSWHLLPEAHPNNVPYSHRTRFTLARGPGTYSYKITLCTAYRGLFCEQHLAPKTIVILPPPPAAPIVTLPANSSSGVYTLAWAPVAQALRYEWSVKTGAGAWGSNSSTTNTSVAFLDQLSGVYEYRVRACNAAKCSAYSTGSIKVEIPAPPSTTAPSPTISGTVDLGDIGIIPASLLDDSAGDWVAITSGSFEVSGGQATYTVPVTLPYAVNNLMPNVSLSYTSSSSHNGVLGVGWRVAPVSKIYRCSANLMTEGAQAQKSNPRYSQGDRLCLDGKKLLLRDQPGDAADADYWASGAEYVTEWDDFSLITKEPSGGFKVYKKSGNILFYGVQANGQQSRAYKAGGTGDVKSWSLDRAEDRYGNHYDIFYDRVAATGEHYISYINMAPGVQVVFSYRDRDDQPFGYSYGSAYKLTKLLDSITTYVESGASPGDGTPVSHYQVGYKKSPITNRYLVSEISECGFQPSGGRICAEPLRFSYQEGQTGVGPTPYNPRYCTGEAISLSSILLDFNSDGYVDLVGDGKVKAWGTAQSCFTRAADQVCPASDGSCGTEKSRAFMTPSGFKFFEGENSGDYNADGLTDYCEDTSLYLQVDNGAAGKLEFHEVPLKDNGGRPANCIFMNNDFAPQLRDIDGDGINDLVHSFTVDPPPKATVKERLSAGVVIRYVNPASTSGFGGSQLLDTSPLAMDSVSAGYSQNYFTSTPGAALFGDVNGDGADDYLYLDETDSRLRVLLGGAASGLSDAHAFPEIELRDFGAQYLYDVNKDGLQDLLYFNAKPFTPASLTLRYAQLSSGELAFSGPVVSPFGGLMNEFAYVPVSVGGANVFKGDINNDGLTDLYNPRDNKYYVAKRGQPDLLATVTDGFGAQAKFTYSELVGDLHRGKPLYTPGKVDFPDTQMSRAYQVVKTLAVSDGSGGFNQTFYHYHGAKSNMQGAGFLGFARIEATDTARGTVQSMEYHQKAPFIGRVKRTQTSDINGKLISITDNNYALHPINGRFPYLKDSVQRSYALTGSEPRADVGTTKTSYAYDEYGNLTSEEALSGYGYASGRVSNVIAKVKQSHFYTNNEARHLLGFRHRTELSAWTYQNNVLNAASLKRVITEFEPEPGTVDVKVARQFVGTALERESVTERNELGVVTGTHSIGKDIDGTQAAPRVTTLSDFAAAIFPQEAQNSLGHKRTSSYDLRFGAVNGTTDPNGLRSTTVYDPLGRVTRKTGANGSVTNLKSFYCASAPVICPQRAAYASAAVVTHPGSANTLGAPVTIQYFDVLQRLVREETYSVNGDVVKTDREYYPEGHLYRVSEPFTGWSPDYWTTYLNYDALGQAAKVIAPDDGALEVNLVRDPDGQLRKTVTTSVISPAGSSEQVATTWTNALGQVSRVEDDTGTPVAYTYDSLGNLATTVVNNDSETRITVVSDVAGNKSRLTDPSAGTIQYEYNGFGELRRQTWAPGAVHAKSITFSYDKLGRQTRRVDKAANGTTTAYDWVWDTRKIGLLTQSSGNGVQTVYDYDGLARVKQVSTMADSRIWTSHQTYDAYGRPKVTTYPNGFKAERRYHAAGLHMQTYNVTGTTPRLLWEQQLGSDVRGNLIQAKLGNGLLTQTTFDEASGRLGGIVTGRLSSTNTSHRLYGDIQNLSYTFNSRGQLIERRSARTTSSGAPTESLIETLHYDSRERLKTSVTTGLSLTARRVDYNYDALGNLIFRSDKGTFKYEATGNASVHAITSGNGKAYSYDQYGNVTKRGSDAIAYNVFNKPTQIGTTRFTYGPEHQRYKQVNGTKVTYYVGGDFEEIHDGGQATQKAYVDGLLVYSKTGGTGKIHYLHRDHSGSVESITDEAGTIIDRLSFNPWGERQQADWKTGTPANLSAVPTTRGFTGHEQLDHLGLIHMNGRVYDPGVGRFLSADLFVIDPYDPQSYNRYSYVRNHPLSATDPSGYIEAPEEVVVYGDRDNSGGSYLSVGMYFQSMGANFSGMSTFNGADQFNFNVEGVTVGVFEQGGEWQATVDGETSHKFLSSSSGMKGLASDYAKVKNGKGLSFGAQEGSSELGLVNKGLVIAGRYISPDGGMNLTAGLGDGMSFGLGRFARSLLGMEGVDTDSGLYVGGEAASLVIGGGRFLYAGGAKAVSFAGGQIGGLRGAEFAIQSRNNLKVFFRAGLFSSFRRYPSSRIIEKYGVEGAISAAGRTDNGLNSVGAFLFGSATTSDATR